MEQLKLRVRNGICICFTAQGKETATRLLEKLSQQMEEAFDFLDYTGSEKAVFSFVTWLETSMSSAFIIAYPHGLFYVNLQKREIDVLAK